ncbi:MAG: 50S ribosomal protein L31, partial [Bacteroidia bacterium]|nr:50S ribosomal protein L31 [Bacteroidia bacterium]
MKKDIHPKYNRVMVTCVTCGSTFETGSTLKEIRVDTCS